MEQRTYYSRTDDAVTAQLIVDEVDDGGYGRNAVGNPGIPLVIVRYLTTIEAFNLEDEPDIQSHTENLLESVRHFSTLGEYLPRTDLPA